jgi:hypothetical protein
MRRLGAGNEQLSLLVKVLTWGALILAGAYFVFLYWITRP